MFKDFDAALKEQEREPIRFRLGGEDFQIDGIHSGPLLRLARIQQVSDIEAAVQFDSFISALIRKEDRKRWDKALEQVPIDVLLEVVQFIVEESTGRPTERPSDLPDRPRKSGQASNTASRKSAKKTA